MSRPGVITIRTATSDDATALADQRVALFEELGQHTSVGDIDPFADRSREAFSQGLADGSCYAWVAVGDGRIVGSTALLIFPRLPSPKSFASREGYLLNVYVDPLARGQGLATALVATAIKHARALELARIRLHATPKGEPVYAAAGFVTRADEMELTLA